MILYSWAGDRQDPGKILWTPRNKCRVLGISQDTTSIRSCHDLAYLLPKNTRSWKPWARLGQEFFAGKVNVKAFNRAASMESYPLPRVSDLLPSIGKGKIFSKLDCSNAYFQLALHEGSKPLVTISTQRVLPL